MTVKKHRLAVILVNGDFRIHGENCTDITRDERQSDTGAWYIEVASRHEANIECWGDVSSDNYEEGTPQWHEECDTNASIASRFLPCVPKMPFRLEEGP
jgi:hypothetical protein